jgi:hypothetical protein
MPSGSPLSSPRDLVLHVGSGKTGTSSIQGFLHRNRAQLAELGTLYPQSPGHPRHSRLGLFLKSGSEMMDSPEWRRQKQSDPAQFRKTFRRQLFAELERAGLPRVLFSDEILFGSPASSLRRLRRFCDRFGKSLRIVVYLRRQDDHLVSRYQQGVKIGWVVRLDDWAREDMTSLYDYYARLRMWERLVAPTELVVRRYESDYFAEGSLLQDFLDAVGIDARADQMEQVSNLNESLDAESVEFLRLLNLYRVENESATPGLINNRALVSRLATTSTGPVLTLSDRTLDPFMAQWEDSNQRLAREFLGDASGQLFHLPRKARNTTTEQHLDPTRLDHFLDLSEIPEHMHPPLRALAEREAGRLKSPPGSKAPLR